jgi:hypothetical protein
MNQQSKGPAAGPSHPKWKALALVVGVSLAVVLLAAFSTFVSR